MTSVSLKPAAPQSRVKHSTTEPLRSLDMDSTWCLINAYTINAVCLFGSFFGLRCGKPEDLLSLSYFITILI